MANKDDALDIKKQILESANETFPLFKNFNASVDFASYEVSFVMACADLVAEQKGAVVRDVDLDNGLFSVRYSFPSAGWL